MKKNIQIQTTLGRVRLFIITALLLVMSNMAFAQAIQVLNIPDYIGSQGPHPSGRTNNTSLFLHGYHLSGTKGDEANTGGGASMSRAKAKLTRLANFGPSGTVNRRLTITDDFGTKGSITNISQLNSYDIIYIGTYIRTTGTGLPFNPTEIAILLEWSKQAGKVLMVQEQENYSPISDAMGYSIATNTAAPSTSARPADNEMNTQLFSGVFGNAGTITQSGTNQGYFNGGCTGIPIAENSDNQPAILLNQEFRDVLFADSGYFTYLNFNDPNNPNVCEMSAGNGISTNSDKVWANLWAWAVNEVVNNVAPSAFVTTAGDAYSDDLPLCSGATSITVNVKNHNGAIRRWQTRLSSSSPWTPVAGSAGMSSITYPNPIAGQEFRVRVGNPGCVEVSDEVVVTVFNTGAPTVTSSLVSTCPATSVNLADAHTGTVPPGTQLVWFNSNNPATGTQLTAAQIAGATAGTYYAFYQNLTHLTCYSPASNMVTVTITPCSTCTDPVINTPPTGATYCEGTTNPTALSVTATGTSLSYQWYRNNVNNTSGGTPVGTDSSTYTPVISAITYHYYVVVTSGTCSTTSATATVTVTAKPTAPVASASTLSNFCPVTTANLTTLQPATVTGIDYEWHTVATNPTVLTKVDNPSAVSVGGIYYLYSKTTTGGCYSNASSPVTVTINPCSGCTNSGVAFVNLNTLYTGTHPDAPNTVLEWWTTATRVPGTKVSDPTHVSDSGTYYAFFYDTPNNCYNTNNSTASVVVNILPPCATCTKPGDISTTGGIPTKVGITVQAKQANWPENIPNGFIALQSQNKGMVITRVAKVGGGDGGAPDSSDSINDPKEGMLVYDMNKQCVKLFNGTIWKCIQGCD